MKRVLLYSDRGGQYGAEQVNHRLALALHRAGFDVTFAQPAADHLLLRERASAGISALWLSDEDLYDSTTTAPSLLDGSEAERLFTAESPDLVLFADSCPAANLAAKRVAAERRIPYLVLVHCVQPQWAYQFGHHLAALPGVYREATEVVAVSSDNLRLLHRHFGLPRNRGRVILNGRPDRFFEPREPSRRALMRAQFGFPPESVIALSIGRMETVKGWPDQLDALRCLRFCPVWSRLRLVWVGEGTLLPRVRAIAAMLGGHQVTILPSFSDIPALLDMADLLVHPARFEGMPLVVLEAMAKGLPVIATSVSGIPEAVADTGILLQPAGVSSGLGERLATAICGLAEEREARHRLGSAARARALERFTEARMLDEYLCLVRGALGIPC